jgi:hypothetical protein
LRNLARAGILVDQRRGFGSTEPSAVPVDELASYVEAWVALAVLTVFGVQQCHGSLLTVLTSIDGCSGLKQRPQVVIGHDALVLEILRPIDQALKFFDKNVLQQFGMLFGRPLLLRVVTEFVNGSL